MNRKSFAATAMLIPALALASCSNPASQPETETETTTETEVSVSETTATETVTDTPSVSQVDAEPTSAYQAFSAALDNPHQFVFPPQFSSETNGTFDYAVLDIDGDGTDEVLLKANTESVPSPVKVLFFNGEDVGSTESVLVDGSGGEEGVSYTVFADKHSEGIHQYEATATTLTHQGFTLRDGNLVQTSPPQETVIGNPLEQSNLVEWHSIAAREALANMQG